MIVFIAQFSEGECQKIEGYVPCQTGKCCAMLMLFGSLVLFLH